MPNHTLLALSLILTLTLTCYCIVSPTASSGDISGSKSQHTCSVPDYVHQFCTNSGGCVIKMNTDAYNGGIFTKTYKNSFIVATEWVAFANNDPSSGQNGRSMMVFSSQNVGDPLALNYTMSLYGNDESFISGDLNEDYALLLLSEANTKKISIVLYALKTGKTNRLCIGKGIQDIKLLKNTNGGANPNPDVIVAIDLQSNGQWFYQADIYKAAADGAGITCDYPMKDWILDPTKNCSKANYYGDSQGVYDMSISPTNGLSVAVKNGNNLAGFASNFGLNNYFWQADLVFDSTDAAALAVEYSKLLTGGRTYLIPTDLTKSLYAPSSQFHLATWSDVMNTFHAMDENGDSQISLAEYTNFALAHYTFASSIPSTNFKPQVMGVASGVQRSTVIDVMSNSIQISFIPSSDSNYFPADSPLSRDGTYLIVQALSQDSQSALSTQFCTEILNKVPQFKRKNCLPFGGLSSNGFLSIGCEWNDNDNNDDDDDDDGNSDSPLLIGLIDSAGNIDQCPAFSVLLNISNTNKPKNERTGFLETASLDNSVVILNMKNNVYPPTIEANTFHFCGMGKVPLGRECVSCSAGYYQNKEFGDCIPCKAGTYSSVVGSTSANTCQKCPVGYFSEVVGQTTIEACEKCPIGTFFAASSDGVSTRAYCYPCPTGYYSENRGSQNCTKCAVGKCPSILSNSILGRSDEIFSGPIPFANTESPSFPVSDSVDVARDGTFIVGISALALSIVVFFVMLLFRKGDTNAVASFLVKIGSVLIGRQRKERNKDKDKSFSSSLLLSSTVLILFVLMITLISYDSIAFSQCNRIVTPETHSLANTPPQYAQYFNSSRMRKQRVHISTFVFGDIGDCSGTCADNGISLTYSDGFGHDECKLELTNKGICMIDILGTFDTNLNPKMIFVSLRFNRDRGSYATRIDSIFELISDSSGTANVEFGDILGSNSSTLSSIRAPMGQIIRGGQSASVFAFDIHSTILYPMTTASSFHVRNYSTDVFLVPNALNGEVGNVVSNDEFGSSTGVFGIDYRFSCDEQFDALVIIERVSMVQFIVALASGIGGVLSFMRITYIGLMWTKSIKKREKGKLELQNTVDFDDDGDYFEYDETRDRDLTTGLIK